MTLKEILKGNQTIEEAVEEVHSIYDRGLSLRRGTPSSKSIRKLIHLKEFTGIEPRKTEEEIQDTYYQILYHSGGAGMREVEDTTSLVCKLTGVEPDRSPKKAQEEYAKLEEMERKGYGFITIAKLIMEFTGVQAGFSEDFVQERYTSMFNQGRSGINRAIYKHSSRAGKIMGSISDWKEITGVSPSEEVMQQAYERHMDKPHVVDLLNEFSGIAPDETR